MSFQMVNTKLEAFKLVHDPTRLLSLLYSKYLDIEEDYGLLISNQIIFNRPTHLNIHFKEQKAFNDEKEFMRRYYHKKESSSRIKKLNDYYKNYQSFFCKAIFTDFFIGNLLKNYQDNKAEIFYKNNYVDSTLNKEKDKSLNYNNSQSLSSLDNLTYNETIFDKKNKQIIENEDKNISITLTLDSLRKKEKGNYEEKNLISTSGLDDSFIECLKNIVYFKDKKKELRKNKKEKKNEKKEVNSNLKNFCKKVNEKFKNKINNYEKIVLEKSDKDSNNSKNLFSILNLGSSINSPTNGDLKYISKRNKRFSNNSNLFLSPQKNNQFNFTNMTSKISQFKKQIPINIKYLNRNKSFHFNNNNKNNRIISNNFYLNTKNNTYHLSNNQRNELNANKGRSFNGTKLRNNSMDKTDMKNNKSNRQKNMKYNKFLLANKNNRNNINLKNKTHELISNGNKINLTNQNILYNHYKKLVQSPRSNRNEMLNHGIGSKYNLFKLSNLSNENINDINKRHNKREFNKKFFISSNSLENNNIHISSLSPKSISSNLHINNEKRRNIGMNKINSNTYIQNNINIINKIKIQPKQNKSNSNYNINFNNLFFYGANTPTNYSDHIKNNIINNQNKNLKFKKINTNFYMLSFNNFNNSNVDNNSKNKNNIHNPQNKKEIKINNNKNVKKNEKEKKYISFKNNGLSLNQNKIPFFTLYKMEKVNNFSRKKSNEKFKNIKLEINNNKLNY